jgi:DNA mismatch repair protein MutS2
VGDAKLLVRTEQIGRGEPPSPRDDRANRIRVERAHPAPDDAMLAGGSLECDMRGLRVDEAIGRLQEAIDRAAADGRDGLRIIHGHGTGALRRAVREHLSEAPLVIDQRPGAEDEGGEGVTVALLR